MTTLHWHDVAGGVGLLVTDEGHEVARYSWVRANHPYFDELRPLNHSGVLTNHAPHDHRWHHGLWWSWKFINDVLFWEDHPDYGGNRIGLGRSVVTDHAVAEHDGGVTIRETLAWQVDQTGETLLTEHRLIRATVSGDWDHAWNLDWDQTWTAESDLRLEVTPWPETTWGGYAGLNYRPARAMAHGELLLAEGNRRGVAAIHGEPAAWAVYSGVVDGAENDEPSDPASGGIALLQHPGDAGPAPIYAFSAVDEFGFLATAPLMRHNIDLKAGDRLRFRTRAAVLGAAVDVESLEHAYAAYGQTVDSPVSSTPN